MYFAYQVGVSANNLSESYGGGGEVYYDGLFSDAATGIDTIVSGMGYIGFDHGQCGQPSLEWTWTASDCAGNSSEYVITVSFASPPVINTCAGDFNFDGFIDTFDLLVLLSNMGCTQNCATDLNGDDAVSTMDILLFLSIWGTFCS
jgi:hypothetical protein